MWGVLLKNSHPVSGVAWRSECHTCHPTPGRLHKRNVCQQRQHGKQSQDAHSQSIRHASRPHFLKPLVLQFPSAFVGRNAGICNCPATSGGLVHLRLQLNPRLSKVGEQRLSIHEKWNFQLGPQLACRQIFLLAVFFWAAPRLL